MESPDRQDTARLAEQKKYNPTLMHKLQPSHYPSAVLTLPFQQITFFPQFSPLYLFHISKSNFLFPEEYIQHVPLWICFMSDMVMMKDNKS